MPCHPTRTAALLVLLGHGALALAACGRRSPDTGLAADERLLAGRRAPVQRLLERLEQLAGTPLADGAHAARERLAACDGFVARCRGDCSLLAEIRCAAASGAADATAERLRGASDFVLTLPVAGDGRLLARGVVSDRGDVSIAAQLFGLEASPAGGAGLLLPAAAPPGAPALSTAQTLIHARVRPAAGLDIAALVPAGGGGDRLFRLKSELFSATALAGTWELAIYESSPGQRIPPLALGVDFVRRELAIAAMERFLADLVEVWPLTRTPYAPAAGADGACLTDLKILPDLAPCYVATERSLVIGWNATSVERALAAPAAPFALGDASGVVVYFDRLAATDASIDTAADGGERLVYPWRRLRLSGNDAGDSYRFQLDLEGGG